MAHRQFIHSLHNWSSLRVFVVPEAAQDAYLVTHVARERSEKGRCGADLDPIAAGGWHLGTEDCQASIRDNLLGENDTYKVRLDGCFSRWAISDFAKEEGIDSLSLEDGS